MIVKVKEPIVPEYPLVRKGQVVFAYFHFACEEELTHTMLKSGAVCVAYETVECADRSLSLLTFGVVPNTSTVALTNAMLRHSLGR